MNIGFIGLGNVGASLANNLIHNDFQLCVHDLNFDAALPLIEKGASWEKSPQVLAEKSDLVITCLPSPKVVSDVMEGKNGVFSGLKNKAIWIEMSTNDQSEILRLERIANDKGSGVLEAPVSGGCHRAATGNISIFVGGERSYFDRAFPALQMMGSEILHVGKLGTASALKVATNFLASTHLAALGEALMVCKLYGIDLKKAYKGILASSGNSFVHETEGQLILNGSYKINFTMDLACKDVGLFEVLGKQLGIPLSISPKITEIFTKAKAQYGDRAWSSMVVKLLEDICTADLRAEGFPSELIDQSQKIVGKEI